MYIVTKDAAELVGLVSAGGAALGIVVRHMLRVKRRVSALLAQWLGLLADVASVKREVTTNGGSSLKDAVTEIANGVAIDRAARHLAIDTATYELIWDGLAHRTVYVSSEWIRLTGLSPADTEHEGWALSVAPSDRARVMATAASAAETGSVFFARYHLENVATHVQVHIDHIGTPVVTKTGAVIGWVGVLTRVPPIL